MGGHKPFINKAAKFVIIGFIAASCIQIFSTAMQINLLNDYFVRGLYSEEVFSVLSDKNDARVRLLSGLYTRMESSLGDSYTFQQLNEVSYFDIASDATGVVSAYFLLKIVIAVAKNQRERIPAANQPEKGDQ